MSEHGQLKSTWKFGDGALGDIEIMKSALKILQEEDLNADEKNWVLKNMNLALAGLTGYVHGVKGM